MDHNRLMYFKEKLLKEKEKIEKNIRGKKDDSLTANLKELAPYDNHPADIGTEVFMQEQEKGFENNLNRTLSEIEESLNQIREGNYGICLTCSKPILEERLELIPYLKTCKDCVEDRKLPVEFRQYESINDDYSVKFSLEPWNNVGYDREDAYQDVAKFNIVPNDPSYSTGDNMGIMDETNKGQSQKIENISQEYYNDTLK